MYSVNVGHPKTIKKLKSGDLLLEVHRKQQVFKTTKIFDLKDKISLHQSLNSSKGVIRCPELRPCSKEEIIDNLRPGVERIGRMPPPLEQSVETWPIGVRLVCPELRPVSLEERILVIERVGCGRHATHYFGLNFS